MASDLETIALKAFINYDFERAVQLLTLAISFRPNDAELFAERAEANLSRCYFNEAVADASRAIELDPSMHKAYFPMGDAFYELGKYQNAKEAWELGSSLAPVDARFTDSIKRCDERIAEIYGEILNPPPVKASTQVEPVEGGRKSGRIVNEVPNQEIASSSPPRSYSRRRRSPSPRDRSDSRGKDLPTSLLVHNLHRDCRAEDLRGPFGRFGPLKDIYLPRDYYTGAPRGFGFVQYVYLEDAADAKRYMDGEVLLGREMRVIFAEENRKKPSEMRAREGFRGRSYDRRHSPWGYSRSPSYARTYSRDAYYNSPSPRRRRYSRSVSPRGRSYRGRSYSRSPHRSRSRSWSFSRSRSRSLDYSR